MYQVVIYDLSGHATKALRQGNSHASQFAALDVTVTAPTSTDGVYGLGQNGAVAARRIFIAPFCEGPQGSQFSVRVYGWRGLAYPADATAIQVVVPFFICELLCTTSSRAGPTDPSNAPSARLLRETERMCDTISLTQGSLGQSGYINSTGPGTDLLAYAMIDPMAARLIQFDFCLADTGNDVGMNLLWAQA